MSLSPSFSRRGLLLGGCGLATALALPLEARAGLRGRGYAPRAECPHPGCRYHRSRAGTSGFCSLSLHGELVPSVEIPT